MNSNIFVRDSICLETILNPTTPAGANELASQATIQFRINYVHDFSPKNNTLVKEFTLSI